MVSSNESSDKLSSFPARVFVLVPEKSDKAIIIRRGPAKVVGIFQWNIKTDEIESFQWLKGRIYEYVRNEN